MAFLKKAMISSRFFCALMASAMFSMSVGVFWGEFENLPVGGDGLVQLVLHSQGQAEVIVGMDVSWVEFDGLGEASDGLVQLVLLGQDDAEFVVGDGVFRVEFDGPGRHALASSVRPFGGEHGPDSDPDRGAVRPERRGRAVKGKRIVLVGRSHRRQPTSPTQS